MDVAMQCDVFSRWSAIWKRSEEDLHFSFRGSNVLVKRLIFSSICDDLWRISE